MSTLKQSEVNPQESPSLDTHILRADVMEGHSEPLLWSRGKLIFDDLLRQTRVHFELMFNNLTRPILEDPMVKCPGEQGAKPEWITDADESARITVFFITFAPVLNTNVQETQTPLRTLDGLRSEDIRDAVLDALANPCAIAVGGRPMEEVEPRTLVVFLDGPW